MERTSINAMRILPWRSTISVIALSTSACSSIHGCRADEATLRSFQIEMRAAINAHKMYPAEAVAERVQGKVEMGFDYIHGNKAQNVQVVKSSGSIYLDAAALIAVLQADLPPKPCGLEDIKHFVFVEDFSI